MIIAGAATAGMSRRLQPQTPVPLLDGVACGVRMAEAIAGMRVRPVRAAGLVQTRAPVGLSAPLEALLG